MFASGNGQLQTGTLRVSPQQMLTGMATGRVAAVR